MKVLVTGASGFAGRYTVAELRNHNYDVIGLSKAGKHFPACDITDLPSISDIVAKAKPGWVVHLAGQASVPLGTKDPEGTRKANVEGTRNLLLACVAAGIRPKTIVVSSAYVYGIPASLPVDESAPLHALEPYSASRIEQEHVATMLAQKHQIPIIICRGFNHVGPDQSDAFVASNIAKQVAAIEKGNQHEIVVYNPATTRDFIDVRDVARAYRFALEKGKPGEVYNVCSGRGYSIQQIIDLLASMTTAEIKVRQDPHRARKNDIPDLRGSHDKFTRDTSWQPRIPFEQTLRDLLDYWRRHS